VFFAEFFAGFLRWVYPKNPPGFLEYLPGFLNPAPDRYPSTAINFVHVNGRSLYIVLDWRMESEECTTPSKKGGRIVNRAARGNVQGGYVPLTYGNM